MDLSSAKGMSINDGINAEYCSITYASVDDAVKMILELGQGTLLAKLDLKEAYQVVPAHPHDRPGLGMHWQRKIYIDGALPFGLFSAPKIFSMSWKDLFTIWMTSCSWTPRIRSMCEVPPGSSGPMQLSFRTGANNNYCCSCPVGSFMGGVKSEVPLR